MTGYNVDNYHRVDDGLYVEKDAPHGATIAVAGEAGNAIDVTIQLLDADDNEIEARGSVGFYLADDATGDTPSSAAPDGGIAIATDGAMIEWAANLSGLLVSEVDGDIDITLTESSTGTWYLILLMPNGKLVASDAITFT